MTDGFELLSVISFYAQGVTGIFSALDTIQFFDAPFSLLDVFVSILLLNLIWWYVLRIITEKDVEARLEAAEGRDLDRLDSMDVNDSFSDNEALED